MGNLASPPVREDAFHLEGVPRALCPGRGEGALLYAEAPWATISHLVACESLKLGPARARWG